MLVSVFLTTLYSVWDPRSDARSSPSSPTLRPRYSVSSAAAEPSRRPLMASTSATLLAFGTASPPWLTGGRGPRPRLPHTKTDGPEDRPSACAHGSTPEVLACAGARRDGPSCLTATTGRSSARARVHARRPARQVRPRQSRAHRQGTGRPAAERGKARRREQSGPRRRAGGATCRPRWGRTHGTARRRRWAGRAGPGRPGRPG